MDGLWSERILETPAQFEATASVLAHVRVIGADSEGVWNETGASFAFQIVPVFWRTWWFQLSMAALGLSIAGAV